MLQEITMEEAKKEGKAIAGYDFSFTCGQMVIVFRDGTFTTLGIQRGWESGDEEIEESYLELSQFGDDKLIELGIITAQELETIKSEKDKKYAEAQEKHEKAYYERLKRKYG